MKNINVMVIIVTKYLKILPSVKLRGKISCNCLCWEYFFVASIRQYMWS